MVKIKVEDAVMPGLILEPKAETEVRRRLDAIAERVSSVVSGGWNLGQFYWGTSEESSLYRAARKQIDAYLQEEQLPPLANSAMDPEQPKLTALKKQVMAHLNEHCQ